MTIRNSRKSSRTSLESSLQSRKRREKIKKRSLLLENLEDRRVMAAGPDLAGIQPNNGALLVNNAILKVAPKDLTFRFTNEVVQDINPASLSTSPSQSSVRLVRAGKDGSFTNGVVQISPGYINTGDTGLEVVMRFADPLPDDKYRIIIVGAGTGPALRDNAGNRFNDGRDFQLDFTLDLGAQVIAVVPQPLGRNSSGVLTQQPKNIDVYFNDDRLNQAAAQNPNFYQLIVTKNTATPVDDVGSIFKPQSVVYTYTAATNGKPAISKATLTFASDLTVLNPNNYAMRLRIGTDEAIDGSTYAPIAASEPLSTFAGALNVGALTGSKVYQDGIWANKPYDIQWPGGNDDPGHRDTPVARERHLADGAVDSDLGVAVQFYNFRKNIGTISSGQPGGSQPAFNLITENQKQRVREVFDLYSRYSGVQFVETQDKGFIVGTGDLRVIDPTIFTVPGGVRGLAGQNGDGQDIALMDSAETDWGDLYGENYFQVAMHEIGHLLGLGHAYDQPDLTIMGSGEIGPAQGGEPVFPGDVDITHMRRLFRPEGADIDMYKFTIGAGQTGEFIAETFAERLEDSSLLDTHLRLFQQTPTGVIELAINDDYFSEDSLIKLELGAGTYFVGVSAKGNDKYDPVTPDSGIGGTSEGIYRLRMQFRPSVSTARTIVDTTGTPLDGDADGTPGGVNNFWFKTAKNQAVTSTIHNAARTFYVDKSAADGGNGALTAPFNNIATALSAATIAGDIVRIVGNGGADGNLATTADNLAYHIGFAQLSDDSAATPLEDGASLIVPKNVTVMIDAGAILQLRRSRIQVGSTQTTPATDRSGAALQVLGTPSQQVYFTSFDEEKTAATKIGVDANPLVTTAKPGDWGGILFRNDQDRADGRFDWEEHGIFLNYVNFADMRFGGGQVNLDGGSQTVITPIHMVDARPTATNNTITRSADAAMSASPNSFEETTFREPRYQPDGTYAKSYNVDYTRVGPDIHGNHMVLKENGKTFFNSLNGLFVRSTTLPGSASQDGLTVAGRFDDTDIVHIVAENLTITGTPGGAKLEGAVPDPSDPTIEDGKPPISLVIATTQTGGSLNAGTYKYRVVYVDLFGNEGRASDIIAVNVTSDGRKVQLAQLPNLPAKFKGLDSDYGQRFVARRIYRENASGVYEFVGQVPSTVRTFVDSGAPATFLRTLNPSLLNPAPASDSKFLRRPVGEASLKIDPNIVTKFDASRIDVQQGATLIAEGLVGQEVIFTSLSDDRFGAGGLFDTRGDKNINAPNEGEWGGIFAGADSRLSIDSAEIYYGGGLTRIQGDFAGFNAIEIHEADARVANTLLQFNGDGTGGTGPAARYGRGFNSTGAIFVRGAQPIIVNNVVRDNLGAAMSINVNALNGERVIDLGRQSGRTGRIDGHLDNNGPLIDGNLIGNNGPVDAEGFNGLIVRGGTITTESVWDDTDIAHILLNRVTILDFHTFGGLRLESSPTESLVVKAFTESTNDPAGIYANGSPLDVEDRIGGTLQILGQPGFPVVLTSMRDDTVAAGRLPDGSPLFDTNNDSISSPGNGGGSTLPTGPEVNNGILIDDDVPQAIPGFFSYQPDAGGGSTFSNPGGVTVNGTSGILVNQSYIFEYLNFVDVGSDGDATGGAPLSLADTTITMTPTLVSPDLVVSEGNFAGENGQVNWHVETRFDNGVAKVFNTVSFSSSAPLGDLRFINYLDEDVASPSDDFLFTTGTPGANDFRAFTIDSAERVGFSQGGVLVPTPGQLENATYTGWTADEYRVLLGDIETGGTNYTVPGNIVVANLPPFTDPTLGTAYGLNDVTTAFAWNVSESSTSATITSFLELVAENPAVGGGEGEWEGITIDKYANDRNVDSILEKEDPTLAAPGSNASPITSQQLGALAPHEKAGDENRRLGFTVQGQLNDRNDVDVYSFRADAGTEIWIDLDRTTYALDSVVELIDSDGVLLARSNNAYLEDKGTQGLVGDARLMRRTPPFEGRDFYSISETDAGMRVVLPGPAGQNAAYFVRIRSSSSNINNLSTGLTEGAYQLQVRLQEKDEIAGSVIRLADVRYGENGIKVLGHPGHSPLTGEHADVEYNAGANNTQATAQNLGNAAAIDRGSTSVAGNLSGFGDVDWYQFNLDIRGIQGPTAAFPIAQALYSMMFDVDYADGFARPNTQINVYNGAGELILTSRDSNISDDRPAPLSAANIEDLLRGSAGAADPFIGPTNLVAGLSQTGITTYYVAVSGDSILPAQWDQFFNRVPSNPLVRFQPADSVTRVVEDHFNFLPDHVTRQVNPSTTPQQILWDNTSVVPFNLGDVSLFVQREGGPPRPFGSDIVTVDPFTGANETFVGTVNDDLHDIAFRPHFFTPTTGPNTDKELFGYSRDIRDPAINPQDSESGHFWQINTGDASQSVDRGDDGIITYELVPDPNGGPPTLDVAHDIGGGNRVGYGIQFEALAFGAVDRQNIQLFTVGSRGEDYTANPQTNAYITQRRNLLFQMQPNEGFAIPVGQPLVNGGPGTIPTDPPTYFGAYASAFEYGEILTAPVLTAAEASTIANPFNIADNAVSFSISNPAGFVTFEFDAGPDIQESFSLAQAKTIQDGDFFILDSDNNPNNNNETWFQFDTGSVITVGTAAPSAIQDGETVSINDNLGRVVTYEFDRDGNAQNSNYVLVDIAGLGNPGSIAGNLADAINQSFADGDLNCEAFVARDRISLTNDLSISLSPGLDVQGVMGVASSSGDSPLLQAVPGNQLVDGMVFSISRVNRPDQEFEFDSNGIVTSGREAVPFTLGDSANTVANNMNVAIGNAFGNQITHNVQNNGSIVLISGQQAQGGNLFQQGTSPIIDLRVTKAALFGPNIPVEETDAVDVVGQIVKQYVETNTNFTVGADLNRINFPPPVDPPEPGLTARIPLQRIDVSGMVAQVPGGNNSTLVWTQRVGSALGTANGNTPIPFLAEDLAATNPFGGGGPGVATRIEVALNKVFGANFAQARFDRVYLSGNSNFTNVSQPLQAQGEGPGGLVTGLTVLNGTLYAASDAGGLYIVNPDSFGNEVALVSDPSKVNRVTTQYVTSSRSELEGLNFTALTSGPEDVEGGRYADLLFGLTAQGRLYAFDTAGHLQPIFSGGATNIQLRYREPTTGNVVPLTNAHGLAFSDLDTNLWHVTPDIPNNPFVDYQRQNDPGHGGGASLYFGDPRLAYPALGIDFREAKLGPAAQPYRSYDAPGGAYGSIVSNEFSLVGKTAADQPVLYFTYFAESDQALDSLRVFISGSDPENNFNSGDWKVIGNTSSAPAGLGSQIFSGTGSWRQVRIPLDSFAGLDHLRLRLDFSTAGDMNVGDVDTTGDELRTVAAEFIADGDTFTLSNPTQTFEFNSGYTIIAPAGVSINDGDTFTIRKDFDDGDTTNNPDRKTVTFEFDRGGGVTTGNVAIPVSDLDTAADIARKIVSGIKTNFSQIDTPNGKTNTDSVIPRWLGDNQVNIDFASQVTRTAGSALTTVGSPTVGANRVTVPIHRLMSREDVSQVIDNLLESYYFSQTIVVRGTGTQFDDGDQFTIAVGNQNFNFEFETGFVVNIPTGGGGSGGGASVADGDTIRLRRVVGASVLGDFTFEFDSDNNLFDPTHLRVPFTTADTQLEVARAFRDAITTLLTQTQRNNLGMLPAYPAVISGARVQIGGGAGLTVTTSGAFSTTGIAGTAPGFQEVIHVPSFFTSAAQMAQELNTAFNTTGPGGTFRAAGFSSNYNPNDPARVQLRGVTVDRFSLSQNPGNPMSLEAAVDVVKNYKDMLRIIDHQVLDRGPLGLANSLPLDLPDLDAAGNPQGFISNIRGQNNKFEGVYVDDFVIGFAERGEIVTGATNVNNYVNNPFVAANQITVGDYQLEMRRGPDYVPGSIDTNDRLDHSLVMTAPAGSDITDGKTFTISDGNRQLTFEFDLFSNNNVTPGNVRIPFSVSDRPEVIAKAIREAINSTPVQAVLKIAAQVSDGTLFGQLSGGPYAGRTSNADQVNIIGAVSLQPLGAPSAEPNELKTQAQLLDLTTASTHIVNATIGDKPGTAATAAKDYDLFRVNLTAGQTLFVDIDAQQFGSPLNSLLRLFNSSGTLIKSSNNTPAPGERSDTVDSWLQFTATIGGAYYIGVSGNGNNVYNINTAGGTAVGSTGSYQLEVSLAQSSTTEVVNPVAPLPFTGGVVSVPFHRTGHTFPPPGVAVPISVQRVSLQAGVTYYFDVDSQDGMLLDSVLSIYSGATLLARNDNGTPPGEIPNGDSYLEFTPATTGVYRLEVTANGRDGYVTLHATTTPPSALDTRINDERYGDENQFRDQGQIILDGNRVSNSANWGILIDDGARDNGAAPHQSPPRNLREINNQRLVPGVVVMNNVVYNNIEGGIRFSGVANAAADELGAVPFGRILNNTVYGLGANGTDVGIQVDQNASPTLLNNIVANLATGISVSANSNTTVLGGTVYQGNGTNTAGINLGSSSQVLAVTDPLFVNAAQSNFYPAAGSTVIDSSIASLLDRPAMQTVRNPLGIPPSPILAPEFDSTGALRKKVGDGGEGSGTGERLGVDRGAIDRVDFDGPTSILLNPRDNDEQGIDGDPTTTKVALGNITLFSFEIQLNDSGIGIDDNTVVTTAVRLQETVGTVTRTLVDGTDYVFSYDRTNNKIIMRPTAGIWPLNRNYRITLDNTGTDGIKDLAGNLLQPNRLNGTAVYEIFLGTAIDYGDAPATYGTTKAAGGASHQVRAAYKLGTQISADVDGQPSATASADNFDDGLISYFLTPGQTSTLKLLAQGGGKLDAWLDRNKDGDFLDSGEHIVVGAVLPNNLQKTLTFTFGSTADVKGDSFLRLRYTSAGINSPIGAAPDGEVEDYKVTISGPKYQNPNNRFDVDANGFVQPKDALLVGNEVDNFDLDGDGFVNPDTDLGNPPPNPPPYYDVNGDGRIGRDDAQAVVDFINGSSTLASSATSDNHAPELNNAPHARLASIAENTVDPAGTQVHKLIRKVATDVDADAHRGIAVTGSTGYGSGTWQYKIDTQPWKDIGRVSDSAARLLPGRAYVRFVPNPGFTGEVRLRYRAWDQTQGVSGFLFDTTGKRGGSNSISLAAETATLQVTSAPLAAMSSTFASSSIVYEQKPQAPTAPVVPAVDEVFAAVATTDRKSSTTMVTEDLMDDFFSDF